MFRIAVIGAGVVGGMVARSLSEYEKNIVILEKENDVAMGQSKANSGIVHAGYDPTPGSLKAKLNVRGSVMMEQTCRDLGVKYRNNGTLVAGFDAEDEKELKKLYERGIKNGVRELEIIDGDYARKLEKNLSESVSCALWAKTGSIVCPYELTIHSVGCAMDNGAQLVRNFEVASIQRNEKTGRYIITSNLGHTVESDIIINCAGIHSDDIARMIGDDSFSINGRRGEYYLLDKEAAGLLDMTVFRVPTKMGKGVLATPTVDGNILLGPTSEDVDDKDNKEITREGLKAVLEKEKEFFDDIPLDKIITEFTGVRAHGSTGDFIINMPCDNFINLAAIESPGLSASPAIAEMVVSMLKEKNLLGEKRQDYNPCYNKSLDFKSLSADEKNELISRKPAYGRVVCRCEEVTEGEIIEAVKRNPGARDVDGIKRRTRSGMGRCQGGFCMPSVCEILARELGISIDEVSKLGGKSTYTETTEKAGYVYYDLSGNNNPEDHVDIAVIGGGPAGMAAAVSAKDAGAEKIIVIEREPKLGGILEQCIHSGFGLHRFKKELTGPEYGERYEKLVKERKIPYIVNTMVINLTHEKDETIVTCMNKEKGLFDIHAKAVVLAMGCREKSRGALAIPGDRPAGVYTAGTAQKFVNIMGHMPGRKAVILGSGDIGLIMARRMTLEGAEVKCVCEIMKDSGGLTRNIVQCLKDFNIPLKLRYTVSKIHGRERVEGVTITMVDDELNPIPGTEEYIECDTLLLSVGLIPENELSKKAGVKMNSKTRGPIVDENRMTTVPGIFACGNVVKVHELVDYVSEEGELAGKAAAKFVLGEEFEVPFNVAKVRKSQPKGVSNLPTSDENLVICTVCPNGCRITVDEDKVTGNMCARGKNYAVMEVINPVRTLTTTMISKEKVLIPVRSDKPIEKRLMSQAMEIINSTSLILPISMGDIIIKNILDTDVNIIASKSFNG